MKNLGRLFPIFALLLMIWPANAAAMPAQLGNVVADELVVKLRPGTSLAHNGHVLGTNTDILSALLRDSGTSAAQELGARSNTFRVHVASGTNISRLVRALAANPAVVYAEPNHIRTAMRVPADPVITQQWALRNIHAYEAWDITTGGDVTIALLDTGVSPSHPDLRDKLLNGYDFYNNDADPSDDEGHGTYTAGVAAASTDNGVGIAGICWGCNILPVKVLGSRGQGDDATIAQGIRWAVDQGVRIISMSLGGPDDTQVMRDAVQYAHDRNVLIIAASGNGQADGNKPNYPAAYPTVLAVSATNSNDGVTGFSTTGSFVDIAAPGVGLWSTIWNQREGDSYGVENGTSASCPHVAGAAALALTLRPDLSADQLAEILEAAADDEGAPGKDPEYGYGRLNLLRTVQLAADPNILSRSVIRGVVTGAQGGQVTVSLSNGQQTQPGPDGTYRFENLPAGAYTVTLSGPGGVTTSQQTWVSGTPLSVATLNFSFSPDASQYFAPVPAPADGATYFAETGHTLRGVFKAYWQKHGGLPIFGYPTSEEFVERGEDGREYTVQYFERHRFELHPENATPYNVLLSRLGDTILQLNGRNWYDFSKSAAKPGCVYFEATGHSLCEPFLSYWRANGLELDGRRGKNYAESLALFGAPLSEPQVETLSDGQSYIVQWFERARFESHGDSGVLLGLLSNELAAARGWRH